MRVKQKSIRIFSLAVASALTLILSGVVCSALPSAGQNGDTQLAVGVNGKSGYMRFEDANPQPSSPEEALRWQSENSEGRYIPLYASDGKTVVDQFFLAPESHYGE